MFARIARALDAIELSFETVASADWTVEKFSAHLDDLQSNAQLRVNIGTLRLKQFAQPLHDVEVRCTQMKISAEIIGCTQARASARIPQLGAQSFEVDFTYGRRDGSLDVQARNIKVGTGTLQFSAASRKAGWSFAAKLQEIPIAVLASVAQSLEVSVPLAISSGTITSTLEASGVAAEVASLLARGELSEITANNESGSLATDRLDIQFDLNAGQRDQGWQYEIGISSRAGQAYAEPIFLDFATHAFSARAKGYRDGSGAIYAESFEISHDAALKAHGQAMLDFGQQQPLRGLSLELESLQFPGAYETYLQPMLLDTNFKSLQTSGALAGRISIESGVPRAFDLAFKKIDVDGGAESIALRGLEGQWHWIAQDDGIREPRAVSELSWSSGAVFGLDFGASSMSFATEARDFRLLRATTIPLLDGALQLDSLRARNIGTPTLAFMIDAAIEPLSVERLCKVFGWPEFGGRLSGSISKLRMREGVVTLGTTLEAQVFDGNVRISDLRLEDPFGKWPRFFSSIEASNLDLDLVTSAFSFGRITGRLSGSIRDLELFAWSPVAFDANLFTPENDRTRHRISQRAVENIGSIGGGGASVTAALSSGFLRFFEDFNYARLGISCKLRNEVCEMNGVGPAPRGGYYLVQGRGVPRIDVIGNSRRVDWPRLVQQLIAVTESEGPVVQ